MNHREELEELLKQRLRGFIGPEALAQLVEEIEQLEGQWEEINPRRLDGHACVVNCLECWLEEQQNNGAEVMLYYKGRPPVSMI